MTSAEPEEQPRRDFTRDISDLFGRAAQIATGLAGLSYAFGWILANRFYSQFGESPEDGGVSFPWLAVRAFIFSFAALMAVFLIRFLMRAAQRATPGAYSPGRWATFGIAGSLIVLTPAVAIPVTFSIEKLVGKDEIAPLLDRFPELVGGLIVGVIFAALFLHIAPNSLKFEWNANLVLRGLAGFLTGAIALTYCLLPFQIADNLATNIRDGHSVKLQIFPKLTVFEASRVRVIAIGGADIPFAPQNCVLRLGSNSATAIYYVNKHVVRIPEQSHVIVGPC